MQEPILKSLSNLQLIVSDFDGVFTDNKVIVSENGEESVVCHRGDGMGISQLKKLTDIEIFVLSSEVNKVVAARCEKLNLPYKHGIEKKLNIFRNIVKERGADMQNVLYIGNDINDRECLIEAGVSVVVADAHSDVADLGDITLQNNGGDGAIRELCDLILKIHQKRT